jgi:hypothetical protein
MITRGVSCVAPKFEAERWLRSSFRDDREEFEMRVSVRWLVVSGLMVAAGAAAEAGTYSDAVLGTSGVVAYYRMDEDNATEVGDPLINAASPGTLDGLWGYESGDPDTMPAAGVAGPSPSTGFAGLDEGNFAAYFGGNSADDDGDGDPTNNIPDQMDLGTTSELDNDFATVAFFMQTPGGGNDGRIFTTAQNTANTFRVIYGPANAYPELAVVTNGDEWGTTASWRTEGLVVGDDAWHHVVVVRNGDNAEDAQIYVDGVDVGDTLTDTGDSYGDSDVTARIASRHGWSNYGWGSYAGNLDEFAYWNRALSATEVQAIWEAAGGGGGMVLGDVNLDGIVNGLDVDPFVDVLLNGPFQDEADMNADGEVNGLDVDPFVAAVVGGGVQAVPEPSTLVLLGLGLIACVVLRGRPAQE